MNLFEFLNEDGPRIAHPEDAIFQGSPKAANYVEALADVIEDPGSVSIKWDGGVALYFGNKDGTFIMSDKYMPNKGVFPASPAEWVEYDTARGADRGNLYKYVETVWNGLKAACGTTDGLFKSDLMWVGPLKPVNGQYVFKPTTVEYRVPANSNIGKLIAGRNGGVAVHSFNDAPWDGKTGLDQNASDITILSPTAGIQFSLDNPIRLLQAAKKAVNTDGAKADAFLQGMAKVAQAAIMKFMNHQITKQTTDPLDKWLETNISGKQFELLTNPETGYLYTNADGLNALYNIWNSVYKLKEHLAMQLEKQVKGFEQWTGGKQEGEGFVFNSKHGLVKIVNRAGFGAAHFN
jgi:hypothetical protein